MNKLSESVSPLTKVEREDWLKKTVLAVGDDLTYKYHLGQSVHAGDLGEVTIGKLLCEARHEALDQLAYLAELKRRLIQHDELVERLAHMVLAYQRGATELTINDKILFEALLVQLELK